MSESMANQIQYNLMYNISFPFAIYKKKEDEKDELNNLDTLSFGEEIKTEEDEGLKQKYLNEINQFGFTEYQYLQEQILQNFSLYSQFAKSLSSFPLRMVLKNLVKNLMINQIECLYLLAMLDSEEFIGKQETVRYYIKDFNNSIIIYDGIPNEDNYRLIYVYILFLALQVKYYLNDKSETRVLNIFIQGCISCKFNDFVVNFTQWTQEIQSLVSFNPIRINKVYRKYSQIKTQNDQLKCKDYNNFVEQILNLAPPYFNEDKQKTTKKVKMEVKSEYMKKEDTEKPKRESICNLYMTRQMSQSQNQLQNNHIFDNNLYSYQDDYNQTLSELQLHKGNKSIEIPNHVFDHHDKKDTGLFPGNNKFQRNSAFQPSNKAGNRKTNDNDNNAEPTFLQRQESSHSYLMRNFSLVKMPSDIQNFKNN